MGRLTAALVVLIGTAVPAAAAGSRPMVVYLDQAAVLRLAKPAARVIVGNPAIADVNVESPKLISIFGKTAGQTNLIIFDADDRPLLSRPVVVTDKPGGAVAVHVPGKDGPTLRAYSCAGGQCLRVRSPDSAAASGGATTPPPPAANAPAAAPAPVAQGTAP